MSIKPPFNFVLVAWFTMHLITDFFFMSPTIGVCVGGGEGGGDILFLVRILSTSA